MIPAIVTRLEGEVAGLKHVAGVLAYAQLKTQAPTPAAYVLPLAEDARPSGTGTMLVRQLVIRRFGVLLAVSAKNDRHGSKAEDALDTLRGAVHAALLGWAPNTEHEPVSYLRGRLVDIVGGAVWWQDEYATDTWLRG